MNGWNEVPFRPFGIVTGMPEATLIVMFHEMKYEIDSVMPEGKKQAAKRNGYAKVCDALRAKGYGWLVDGEAPEALRIGNQEPANAGAAEEGAREGAGGMAGTGQGACGGRV